MNYPKQIINDYAEHKITRAQFTKQFSDWQKLNDINYDCKNYGVKGHNYLVYRNICGEIVNGIIEFYDTKKKKYIAKNIFEFERFIDIKKAARCTVR